MLIKWLKSIFPKTGNPCSLCKGYDDNIVSLYDSRYSYHIYYHKSCLHEICLNPEGYTKAQVRQATSIIKKIEENAEFQARARENAERQYIVDCKFLKEQDCDSIGE